jgi:hypothetical protein
LELGPEHKAPVSISIQLRSPVSFTSLLYPMESLDLLPAQMPEHSPLPGRFSKAEPTHHQISPTQNKNTYHDINKERET